MTTMNTLSDILTSPSEITLDSTDFDKGLAAGDIVYVTVEDDEITFSKTPISPWFESAHVGQWFDHVEGRSMQFIGEYRVREHGGDAFDLMLTSEREVPCEELNCRDKSHFIDVLFPEPEHTAWELTDDASGQVQVIKTGDEPWTSTRTSGTVRPTNRRP